MTEPTDHKPLFMMREEEGGPEWLTDRPDYYPFSRPAMDHEVTAGAMAAMLDQDAESANNHGFVGAHAALAEILDAEIGPVVVKRIFRRLVDAGGLHNLNGR